MFRAAVIRARIVIPVNVSSSSDPRRTRDILINTAKDDPRVMSVPEPSVDFEDFGADSLNFKALCVQL